MTNDFSFNYEKVSIEEAGALLNEPLDDKGTVKFDEKRAPSAPHEQALMPSTRAWMDSLPDNARPLALAEKYPRIANELSHAWHFRAKFKAKMFAYMIDERGDRQGFPADVVVDLTNLKAHFDSAATTGARLELPEIDVPAAQRSDLDSK